MIRWLLPIAILAAGVGGYMALANSKSTAVPVETREKTWIVATETITVVDQSPIVTLYGSVESAEIAELSAALTADVAQVNALEGQAISKGEIVLRLDDRDAVLILRQREAEEIELQARLDTENLKHANNQAALRREQQLLELSRTAVSRAKELAASSVGSQSQLDAAKQDEARQILVLENRESLILQHQSIVAQYDAQLARATALTEQARLNVSRSLVQAPFSGRVSEILVAAGDRVSPGVPLVRLINSSKLEIRAQVPTTQLPHFHHSLESGQLLKAKATVDERSVDVTLNRLSSVVDSGTGGVDALFRVSAQSGWLALGRIIELVVQLPLETDVVLVPFEAVYGRERVYTLVEDRMRKVDIEPVGKVRLATGEQRALVRSTRLTTGDTLIVTQLPNAVDGLKVRVATGG